MNAETQLLEPHPECQSKVNWKCIIDQIECNDNLHVTYVAQIKSHMLNVPQQVCDFTFNSERRDAYLFICLTLFNQRQK